MRPGLLLPELGVRGGHTLRSNLFNLGVLSSEMLVQQLDRNKNFVKMLGSNDMGKNYAVLNSSPETLVRIKVGSSPEFSTVGAR